MFKAVGKVGQKEGAGGVVQMQGHSAMGRWMLIALWQ